MIERKTKEIDVSNFDRVEWDEELIMIDSWERLALKYLKHYIILKYTIFGEYASKADITVIYSY